MAKGPGSRTYAFGWLDVPRDADAREIRKRIRELNFQYHPDRSQHDDADEITRRLNNYRDVLLNPQRLAEYKRRHPTPLDESPLDLDAARAQRETERREAAAKQRAAREAAQRETERREAAAKQRAAREAAQRETERREATAKQRAARDAKQAPSSSDDTQRGAEREAGSRPGDLWVECALAFVVPHGPFRGKALSDFTERGLLQLLGPQCDDKTTDYVGVLLLHYHNSERFDGDAKTETGEKAASAGRAGHEQEARPPNLREALAFVVPQGPYTGRVLSSFAEYGLRRLLAPEYDCETIAHARVLLRHKASERAAQDRPGSVRNSAASTPRTAEEPQASSPLEAALAYIVRNGRYKGRSLYKFSDDGLRELLLPPCSRTMKAHVDLLLAHRATEHARGEVDDADACQSGGSGPEQTTEGMPMPRLEDAFRFVMPHGPDAGRTLEQISGGFSVSGPSMGSSKLPVDDHDRTVRANALVVLFALLEYEERRWGRSERTRPGRSNLEQALSFRIPDGLWAGTPLRQLFARDLEELLDEVGHGRDGRAFRAKVLVVLDHLQSWARTAETGATALGRGPDPTQLSLEQALSFVMPGGPEKGLALSQIAKGGFACYAAMLPQISCDTVVRENVVVVLRHLARLRDREVEDIRLAEREVEWRELDAALAFVVPAGPHQGKTLAWVANNEYLYLRQMAASPLKCEPVWRVYEHVTARRREGGIPDPRQPRHFGHLAAISCVVLVVLVALAVAWYLGGFGR